MIMDLVKQRARGRGSPSISLEETIENIRNDPHDLSRMLATLFAMRHALFPILRQVVQVICPNLSWEFLWMRWDDFETGERRGMIRYRSVSRELSG